MGVIENHKFINGKLKCVNAYTDLYPSSGWEEAVLQD